MSVVAGLVIACSGFLLAVLWMDLIFDTQAAGRAVAVASNFPNRCWRRSPRTTAGRPRRRSRWAG